LSIVVSNSVVLDFESYDGREQLSAERELGSEENMDVNVSRPACILDGMQRVDDCLEERKHRVRPAEARVAQSANNIVQDLFVRHGCPPMQTFTGVAREKV